MVKRMSDRTILVTGAAGFIGFHLSQKLLQAGYRVVGVDSINDYYDPKLIRPYRVGMSCAFCHVSFHPLHPPADPAAPTWQNLSTNIGAQYFWVGRIFGYDLTKRHTPGPLNAAFARQVDLPRLREAQVSGATWIITTNPARILQLQGYGIEKGCNADFVLLQARDPVEALRLKATRLKVFKRGKLLAETPARTASLKLQGRPGHTSFMQEISPDS